MNTSKRTSNIVLSAIAAGIMLGLLSCGREADDQPAGSDGWLTGTIHQKFDTLADQQQGFSHTMTEVGYRYTELFWAGEDENWEFAAYQIEHILEALELGFQRRPARRASAEHFLTVAMPQMEEAVRQRNRALFHQRFADLATHCNACHALEQVSFIHVRVPTVRHNPWGGQ